MNTLPNLPIEIINKINDMAREMEIQEYRELNRAVRFNNCMKWIDYEWDDYIENWGEAVEDQGYTFYYFLKGVNFFD